MMSKASEGFIPKHLRKPDEIPINIDELINSVCNSRKHSEEIENEDSAENVEQDLKNVVNSFAQKLESTC